MGECLGSGQFGSTYEALGPFDQPYAIKILTPANRPYHEVRDEWLKEAERLYRLRHPNIVYVHDYFELSGQFYLVLERCHHNLESMLGQPFTERFVIEVARQLLFAVQYLSDNGIIHNDLHPGNILVVQGEPVVFKLSDLGIALELYGHRAARPEIVQHRIMAPEVAAGGYTTRQSDLYQLGLLLYRMISGQPAVDVGMGYEAMIDQIRAGVPRQRAEALGTPLGGIIAAMLRRHEQYRYAAAEQVWADLRRLDAWQADLAEAVRGIFSGENPQG
jgi:serine/threonine-protein kinase